MVGKIGLTALASILLVVLGGSLMYLSDGEKTRELREPIYQQPELYIIDPHSHIEVDTDARGGFVRVFTYNSTETITLVAASNPSLVYVEIPQFAEIEESFNESHETYALNNGDSPAFLLVSKTDYPIRIVWPWWWGLGFVFVIIGVVLAFLVHALYR